MKLLEREEALATLDDGLERARVGSGVVALVRGEAGIGKTSLVRSFVDDLSDRAHVLWGACDDLTTARPLGPIWDMSIDEPALASVLAGDDRNLVFQYVRDLLLRGLRPTVMVVEDIQWADDTTLDLISFLGRRLDRTHGLLVLTYRDGDPAVDQRVRRTLGDLPSDLGVRLRLDALSRDAVARLAGSADVDEIVELTGGNPFLVTELVANAGDDVPQSITDSVGGRLARLDADARTLAHLVSVVPGSVELPLLTALAGDESGPLERCEQSGLLVVEQDTVRFRHELARRAVEAGLSNAERRDLNSKVLEILDEGDLARLAHHAREAADPAAMLRILPAAARQAAAVESHHQAMRHLRALEPYLDRMSPEARAEHYDLWAQEAQLIGDPDALAVADRAVEQRRELGVPAALAKSLLTAATVAWNAPDADGVDARFEQAIEVLEEVAGDERASAYAATAQIAQSRYEPRALALAERALALNGDARNSVRVQALNVVGGVISGRFPLGIDELTEAYLLAKELGLAREAVRSAMNLSTAHYKNMELYGAWEWASVALGLCDDAEYPDLRHACLTYMASVSLYQGNLEEVGRLTSAVVDLESASWRATHWAEAVMAHAKVRQGAPGARSHVQTLWKQGLEAGHLPARGPIAVALGELAWLDGELDSDNRDQIIRLVHETLDLRMRFPAALHAVWLVLGGWMDGVEGEISAPYRQLIDGEWETAASSFEQCGMPYERAVALSLGDVDSRLRALKILDDLGAAPLAAKVRRSLQAEGVKGVPRGPYRGRRASPVGLTPRQTEILGLLGEGLSNSEIADRLFLSVRTVENHVSAIMTTLGASNRTEAVRLAASGTG